jgi:hypothetical protein
MKTNKNSSYGIGKEHEFDVHLHPNGALVYSEGEVTVELLQNSLLSWHGEFTLIPGKLRSGLVLVGDKRLARIL